MNKDTSVKKATIVNDRITVTLTAKKMEDAGVSVDISHNGDLHLSLPEMSEEQRQQLNGVWDRLRHDLQDNNIDPAVISAILEIAVQTHWQETNARIIVSLL